MTRTSINPRCQYCGVRHTVLPSCAAENEAREEELGEVPLLDRIAEAIRQTKGEGDHG